MNPCTVDCNPAVLLDRLVRIAADVAEIKKQLNGVDEKIRGNGSPGLVAEVAEVKTWQKSHVEAHAETKKDLKAILIPLVGQAIAAAVGLLLGAAVVAARIP